jgi:hypothetical protein
MGTHPRQGTPNGSPTVEALRRQLEADRQPPTPEEQAQMDAARDEWERDMERLDAEYQAMLDADPALRQRLSDKQAVLNALLDAVAEDRGERA